jgi:hypothetical protein
MSTDNKPRIQLRLVDKNQSTSQIITKPSISTIAQEPQEKKKGKRGRPRKNPIESEVRPIETVKQIQPKKRGRKKKQETVYSLSSDTPKSQTTFPTSFITKNYIVQLKVKSTDLEKIHRQFINKTQEVGYKPLISQKPIPHTNSDHLAEIEEKQKDNNFDEYYKLLNNLEMPLIPVTDLSQQKMGMVCGNLGNDLPEIANIYQNIIIPVLPENIPIKLFDESNIDQDDYREEYKGSNNNKQIEENCRAFRNTTNLVLPQFNNGGQWPEKSPYACWNCDIFFDGTPIGNVEKEVNGHFHCYGNFCDFPCAARYLSDRESTTDFWSRYSLLCVIYQKAHNLPPGTKVPIAPPRESLTKYGGKLSYEEYHQATKLNKIIEIYKLPLIPVLLHIEEISKATNINNIIQKNSLKQAQSKAQPKAKKISRFIPIDPQKLSKAEENLKQKAQERLQSNYTLDDCFNHK